MRNTELEQLTVYLVTEYYKNNSKPFFQYADEDILWLGPRTGQMISSKKNLMRFFTTEATSLTFEMRGLTAQDIRTGPNTWEILLQFLVLTFFPSGEVHEHNQRMQFSWVQSKKKNPDGTWERNYRICLLNIANLGFMEDMALYARSPSESAEDAFHVKTPGMRGPVYIFQGMEDETYYLSGDEILYIESESRARHSRLFPADRSFEALHCRESLNEIEKKYPEAFLRPHIGYLINPYYVTRTARFEVSLQGGITLPVPEKKYTAFKEALRQCLDQKRFQTS